MIGQTIATYRVEALLGEGGMGSVYRAVDINLGRPVALKLIHPHLARQPEFRDRFLQEARSAANLSHPSIVRIYQFDAQGDLMLIAMEYFPGGTLTGHLRRVQAQNQRIDLRESLFLLAQIADALDYAHRRGVVHRDIKPDNILMSHLEQPERPGEPPLRAVVTDFGLAKLRTGAAVQTQDGTFMGTLPYMSPEQCLGKALDGRTDIYALGVMLYQMTTNRLPFDVKTPTEAILKHINEPPPPPRDFSPNLPEAAAAIILKCLEKDPEQRYTTAADLAAALRSATTSLTEEQATMYAPPDVVAHLNTQLMPGGVETRGESVFAGAGSVSAAPQDRLQVATGSGSTGRFVPLDRTSLTIGRDPSCDLVLDDNRASRSHARIDFNGQAYTVTDLNSTNGTFLAGARLLPGIPETWPVDKVLQIGDSFLRIVPARQPPLRSQGEARMYTPAGSGIPVGKTDPTAAYVNGGGATAPGRVGLTLSQAEVTADPGQPVTVGVNLFNQGSIVDHFRLSLEGLPLDWLPSMPPTVQLMPGAQQQLTITITPPRSPQARAGSYPVTVRAVSQDNPNQSVAARLSFVLKPYSHFTTEIFPQRLQAGATARLTVTNQGNAGQTFTAEWTDRGDELIFEPRRADVSVAEGKSAVVEFHARPKQRAYVGGSTSYNFNVRVAAPQGETQTQSGELISRALIPTWLIPILASACVCLGLVAGGAVLGGRGLLGFLGQATATVTPGAVGLLDTDGDGLPDAEEIRQGTDINNPDTDGDGISDYQEVLAGTDPLVPNAPPQETATTGPTAEVTATPPGEATPTTAANTANPLVVRLVQPNPGDYQPAREALVFQLLAYDPLAGTSDGSGIRAVDFEFFDSGGALVYRNSETSAGYCAFQGGEPDCNQLNFIRSKKQWPNGAPIFNGNYNLVMTAHAPDGRTARVEYPFSIQMPPPRMVYTSDRNGGAEIFVYDMTGRTETNLTNNTNAFDASPAWSPDGNMIVFSTFRDGNNEIYVMNADGSQPRNITNAPGSAEYDPAWTADGRFVAYSSDRLGALNIYITSVTDGSTFQVTYNNASDYQPSFSPDGRSMVFVSDRGSGEPDLYLMDFDPEAARAGREGQVRVLFSSPSAEIRPKWSPDGRFVAFASSGLSDSNIFYMEVNGTPRQVTTSNMYETDPAWLPDGRQIAFSQIESFSALYSAALDGSRITPILAGAGYSNSSADFLP